MKDIEYNTLELKKFIDELRLKGINDFARLHDRLS